MGRLVNDKELNLCAKIVRFAFIGVNIFFLAVGLGLVGLGIYLLVVDSDFSFVTGTPYASGAVLLLIGGVITCVISAFGVLGGIGKWWALLLIYSILLIIVIVLEIVAGVLGFVFQAELEERVSDTLNTTINEYLPSNDTDFQADLNSFMDTVQSTLECCGNNGPEDWLDSPYFNSTMMLPASCNCDDASEENCTLGFGVPPVSIYSQGCNDTLVAFLQANALIIGACGVVIGVVEIVGVVLSFILCCCLLFSGRKSHEIY